MHAKFQCESRSGLWITLASMALISILGSTGAARAATCDDQKGSVIFEDTFADDSGGWESDSALKLGGGALTMHLDPKYDDFSELNGTFNASDADYCMEVVVPKSVADDNPVTVGLLFWAADYNNFFLVQIQSDGHEQLYRRTAGTWAMVADLTNPSVKLDPGSVAAIRVQAAGNLIAPTVNGVDLKKVRAQMPSGPLKFGVHIETFKDNPAPGISVSVKRFRVTDGK
jgi:hypothetical protein